MEETEASDHSGFRWREKCSTFFFLALFLSQGFPKFSNNSVLQGQIKSSADPMFNVSLCFSSVLRCGLAFFGGFNLALWCKCKANKKNEFFISLTMTKNRTNTQNNSESALKICCLPRSPREKTVLKRVETIPLRRPPRSEDVEKLRPSARAVKTDPSTNTCEKRR